METQVHHDQNHIQKTHESRSRANSHSPSLPFLIESSFLYLLLPFHLSTLTKNPSETKIFFEKGKEQLNQITFSPSFLTKHQSFQDEEVVRVRHSQPPDLVLEQLCCGAAFWVFWLCDRRISC